MHVRLLHAQVQPLAAGIFSQDKCATGPLLVLGHSARNYPYDITGISGVGLCFTAQACQCLCSSDMALHYYEPSPGLINPLPTRPIHAGHEAWCTHQGSLPHNACWWCITAPSNNPQPYVDEYRRTHLCGSPKACHTQCGSQSRVPCTRAPWVPLPMRLSNAMAAPHLPCCYYHRPFLGGVWVHAWRRDVHGGMPAHALLYCATALM